MAPFKSAYRDDSDADDEFERSEFANANMQDDYEDDGIDSDPQSPEHTPTTFTHSVGHVSPQGRITEWSSDQAADFVSGLGLDQYANAFVDQSIGGAEMVELQHADLKDMGIDSFGHRLAILKSIYEVKVKQNIPLDPDHFIPLSADAGSHVPTQDDISRIIRIIKDRDEKIHSAESELRILRDDLNRLSEENRKLREEFLPLARLAKQALPLPNPDAEKGPGQKLASPTFPDGRTLTDSSNLDPSAAALTASNHLAANLRDGQSATSPHTLSQPSPTSPAYSTGQPSARMYSREGSTRGTAEDYPQAWASASVDTRTSKSRNNANDQALDPPGSANSVSTSSVPSSAGLTTPTQIASGQSSGSSNPQVEIFKSFRVSIDDPCHKVLPVALKKYNITADWRQYALYIVHGDQERCLGLNEKPLILFKQLDREGRKPMFMLRKHAQPMEGHVSTVGGAGVAGRDSVGGLSGGAVQIPGGVL